MSKITPTVRARLGGLARAQKLSAQRRSEIARQGGEAFMEKYGKEGLLRARYGLKVDRSPVGKRV